MSPRTKVLTGLAVLTLAAGLAAGRLDVLQGDRAPGAGKARPAPAFVGIDRWINSEPLTLQSLRGKVVLVDFWTYTCINCVRTFDHLRALHDRYAPAGLKVVGIHSPEFEFEKDPQRVAAAVKRHQLPYPVALDNDMATWRAYRNNYWPHVYLIDTQGRIRFDHIGEGGEADIEREIRKLLPGRLPAPLAMESDERPSQRVTPEIYAGFERGGTQGSLLNADGYRPGEDADYGSPRPADFDALGTDGLFLLEGRWRAEREYVESTAGTARIHMRFRARNVFVVAAPGSAPSSVRVLLDGEPVAVPAYRGQPAGEQVVVTRADLYRLVALDDVETHTLTLEPAEGFRLFTFTFG